MIRFALLGLLAGAAHSEVAFIAAQEANSVTVIDPVSETVACTGSLLGPQR